MFKINLTGADETVRLSENAGLICAPRDIEAISDALEEVGENGDKSINNIAKVLASDVVRDWYGLFDEDGSQIEFDPELVSAVMSDPVVLQAFRDQYLNRLLYVREEGNASSPSQNGTSGAGETIAAPATKTARRAPTAKKSPKASKAKPSGG